MNRSEFASENNSFWGAVERFRRCRAKMSEEQALQAARDIYDSFVSEQALAQVSTRLPWLAIS